MYWKLHPEMLEQMKAGEAIHMPMSEQLLVALMGLAVVFLCLIVLAVAVMIISKIMSGVGGSAKKAAPAPVAAAPAAPALDEESMAVVMAAVCEDCGLPLDQVRIKSVQEM